MATKKAAPAPTKKAPGTAVAVKKAGGVVDLAAMKAQMAAEVASLAGRTAAPGGDKVQLSPGNFKCPDGTETDTLTVVIVDFVAANTFYQGAYDKNNITPPTCFALGQIVTQLVPSPNSPVLQSDSCAGCPLNQYESATTGKGKACKNGRKLAILPPGADADDPFWVIEVSPTSLKSFDGYVRAVAAKFGVTPVGVLTTITMDPNVAYPKLIFGDPQPNEDMAEHYGRKNEALERLMTEPDVSAYEAPQPPKAKARVAPKVVGRAR